MYTELTKSDGCTVSHNLDELENSATDFGHVQHSTQVIVEWLIQLRIDAAKTQLPANDNQPEVRKANG